MTAEPEIGAAEVQDATAVEAVGIVGVGSVAAVRARPDALAGALADHAVEVVRVPFLGFLAGWPILIRHNGTRGGFLCFQPIPG
jgi:hypothetical protein